MFVGKNTRHSTLFDSSLDCGNQEKCMCLGIQLKTVSELALQTPSLTSFTATGILSERRKRTFSLRESDDIACPTPTWSSRKSRYNPSLPRITWIKTSPNTISLSRRFTRFLVVVMFSIYAMLNNPCWLLQTSFLILNTMPSCRRSLVIYVLCTHDLRFV